MNAAQIFLAINRRETQDGAIVYFHIPAVIFGVTFLVMILAMLGVGSFDLGDTNIHEVIAKVQDNLAQKEDAGARIASAYWGITPPVWMTLPFILYFGLSATLYDERKDRSVLFYKSMPVADWQEVIGRLVNITLVGPILIIGVMIVAQLLFALIATIFVMAHGGPAYLLWPLPTMIWSWIGVLSAVFGYFLWALPLFAWLLFVSAASPKVPFLVAGLPVGVLIILEFHVFGESHLGRFVVDHAFRGYGQVLSDSAGYSLSRTGLESIITQVNIGTVLEAIARSFTQGSFWLGLAVAAAFLYGAVEARRRNL